MKLRLLSLYFLFSALGSYAQDLDYARHMIDTLCSSGLEGRGYVNGGDRKAAELIAGQFSGFKLLYFGKGITSLIPFP